MDWWNLMKQSVTVWAQLLWSSRYGCNNGRYGCTIVMSYIEINKAVSQWLSTFNLCVSVTWPLTCAAFHIPCTHTPEIIDMHRGVCDNKLKHFARYWPFVRESTGDRWIPLTKASDAELWCFLWSAPEQTVERTIETPVILDAIAHYVVIVLI